MKKQKFRNANIRVDKISKLKKYQIKFEKLSKNNIFFFLGKPKWNITKKICLYLYSSIDTLMNDTLFIEIIHFAIYKDE